MMNEKMQILKMLEEGRITAEDAARLLEAAGTGTPSPAKPRPAEPSAPSAGTYSSSASNDPTGRRKPSSEAYSTRGEHRDEGPRESFTEEISRKFETFFKDMEPKLQKFTEKVVEKTSNTADAISRSIYAPPPPSAPRPDSRAQYTAPRHEPRPESRPSVKPSSAAPKARSEKDFELKVVSSESELNISGFNGQVLLKGYNGDKISAKVYYTARRGGAAMDLMVLGSKYYLNYDENDYDTVSIDAYIPESMFRDIKVATNNGALIISTVKTKQAKFENSNGDIEISGFACDDLEVESNNGAMRLSGVSAERAIIDNFNGAISASDVDISQLKLSTFNGGVNMHIAGYERFSDYLWAIESNNGRINMILPSSVDFGYYIKASAALSDVKLGLTGLSYIENAKSFAEAQSVNFDLTPKKIKLLLESSNSPITVN